MAEDERRRGFEVVAVVAVGYEFVVVVVVVVASGLVFLADLVLESAHQI